MSALTDVEVRVEACLRRLIPEGDVRNFTDREALIYSLSGDRDQCSEDYGEDSGPARGALLDLVRAAWRDPDLSTSRSERWEGGSRVWIIYSAAHKWRALGTGPTETLALVATLEAAP